MSRNLNIYSVKNKKCLQQLATAHRFGFTTYTDHGQWALSDRRKRKLIAAAGVSYFE